MKEGCQYSDRNDNHFSSFSKVDTEEGENSRRKREGEIHREKKGEREEIYTRRERER